MDADIILAQVNILIISTYTIVNLVTFVKVTNVQHPLLGHTPFWATSPIFYRWPAKEYEKTSRFGGKQARLIASE
jgi:hypothetical protein